MLAQRGKCSPGEAQKAETTESWVESQPSMSPDPRIVADHTFSPSLQSSLLRPQGMDADEPLLGRRKWEMRAGKL